MLTIKILFTINSLEINYFVKRLFTIPFVKKTLSFDYKKIDHIIKTKIIQIKDISFQLKQLISIKKRRNYFQGQLHSY